jgi:hypothetical protein
MKRVAPLRLAALAVSATLALAAPPAAAQTIDGARPGHVPGVEDSLPYSTRASNIGPTSTGPGVAPTLPQPAVGQGAEPEAYVQAARAALASGRTGLAQQALEMAETQMLHRSVTPGQLPGASSDSAITTIRGARMLLGDGRSADALALLGTLPDR